MSRFQDDVRHDNLVKRFCNEKVRVTAIEAANDLYTNMFNNMVAYGHSEFEADVKTRKAMKEILSFVIERS